MALRRPRVKPMVNLTKAKPVTVIPETESLKSPATPLPTLPSMPSLSPVSPRAPKTKEVPTAKMKEVAKAINFEQSNDVVPNQKVTRDKLKVNTAQARKDVQQEAVKDSSRGPTSQEPSMQHEQSSKSAPIKESSGNEPRSAVQYRNMPILTDSVEDERQETEPDTTGTSITVEFYGFDKETISASGLVEPGPPTAASAPGIDPLDTTTTPRYDDVDTGTSQLDTAPTSASEFVHSGNTVVSTAGCDTGTTYAEGIDKADAATNSAIGFDKSKARRRRLTGKQDKENRVIQAKREYLKKLSNGVVERSKMTMFDFIYYNPPAANKTEKKCVKPTSMHPSHADEIIASVSKGRQHSEDSNDAENIFNSQRCEEESVDDVEPMSPCASTTMRSRTPSTSTISQQCNNEKESDEDEDGAGMPAPRVKVGPDGQIVLDEKSLMIETTENKLAREGKYSLPEYPSAKRKRSSDWSNSETVRFYRALNAVGTDFSLMGVLFKNRSRYELKAKYKKEERLHPSLVNIAMQTGKQFNIAEIEKEFQQAIIEEEAAKVMELERKSSRAVGRPESKCLPYNEALELKEKTPRPSRRRSSAKKLPPIVNPQLRFEIEGPVPLIRRKRLPPVVVNSQTSFDIEGPAPKTYVKDTRPQENNEYVLSTIVDMTPPLPTMNDFPTPLNPNTSTSPPEVLTSNTQTASSPQELNIVCNTVPQDMVLPSAANNAPMQFDIDPKQLGNPGNVIVFSSPLPSNPSESIYQFYVVHNPKEQEEKSYTKL